jgi:hypothetical protein
MCGWRDEYLMQVLVKSGTSCALAVASQDLESWSWCQYECCSDTTTPRSKRFMQGRVEGEFNLLNMGVLAVWHVCALWRSPEFHYNLPNSSCELIVSFTIVICYICGFVYSDVRRFIRGENDAGGVFDP